MVAFADVESVPTDVKPVTPRVPWTVRLPVAVAPTVVRFVVETFPNDPVPEQLIVGAATVPNDPVPEQLTTEAETVANDPVPEAPICVVAMPLLKVPVPSNVADPEQYKLVKLPVPPVRLVPLKVPVGPVGPVLAEPFCPVGPVWPVGPGAVLAEPSRPVGPVWPLAAAAAAAEAAAAAAAATATATAADWSGGVIPSVPF